MRVTDTIVNFELINNDAQNSAIFSSSGNKNFGNLELLNIQTKKQTLFMDFELNQSILDGSLIDFYQEEQTNIAFFSDQISDENCKFQNVWVQADLSQKQNFIGITLDFGEFFPKKVTVEYFKDNLRMLHKTIDEIDNSWIYCALHGKEINKVKVNFDESWAPFQYANLQEFIFGNVIEWTSDDIISANFQEETDIISKILPNNTLNLVIYSKDNDFNVLNPRSSYEYLLPGQKFKIKGKIYEIDDETHEIQVQKDFQVGEFFLDSWESLYNKQIKFNLISPLAIPVCSHKQAIHHVAFACNCMVYDNRKSKIVIEPFDSSSSQEIQSSEIFDPITVKRKETVTGLTVTVHNFKLKSSREEVFKGYLEQGTKEIILNNPCVYIQSSSNKVEIQEQGINYVILDVLENGEYTLTGLKYEDLSYKYTKEIFDDFSIKKNNLEIDKVTIINPNNVEFLSEKWISYFRMYNLSIEFKFISNGQKTGQNLTFIDSDGHLFTGALIRQNIDIGKGFLSSCYLLGYQHLQEIEPNPQFAGDDKIENSKVEIYSNEDYGII